MKSDIPGVVIFEIEKHVDDRGSLAELFRHDCLLEEDIPKMAYISMTKPNVIRGPHEHKDQKDLFFFIGPGEFNLYLWGGDSISEVHAVGESYPCGVIVPPGVVHGYKCISEYDGMVINAPNALYGGPGGKYPPDEIRHENEPNSVYQIPSGS